MFQMSPSGMRASNPGIMVAVIAHVISGLRLHTGTVDVDGVVVLDGAAGGTGVPRVQPASAQGPELLPDHGAPGGDDPCVAGEESFGQRPRRQAGLPFLARCVDAAGAAAAAWWARPVFVDSKRRDGRVVDGARLESDFGEQCQAIPKHLVAQRVQRFTPQQCSSV